MTRFLSIADLASRWSCGRTFVYSALAEMEAAGYLQRIWLGRTQRVAVESVERWEAAHSRPSAAAPPALALCPAPPATRRARAVRETTSAGDAIRALRVA